MKKILFLFSMIGMGLFLSSCIDSGQQTLSGEGQLFYISQTEQGKIAYNGGFAMTSNEIKAQNPDRWYAITWSWSSEYGTTGNNIYNAMTSQIDPVPMGVFYREMAPEPTAFFQTMDVLRGLALSNAFGDYLLFSYSMQKAEGETAQIKLYSPLNVDEFSTSGTLILDARVVKTGTASGSEKLVNDVVAIKMSDLRNLVTFTSNETYKNITIKIRYHKDAGNTVETTPEVITIYKE